MDGSLTTSDTAQRWFTAALTRTTAKSQQARRTGNETQSQRRQAGIRQCPPLGLERGQPAQDLKQKNFNNPGNKSCVGVGNNGKLSGLLSVKCAFSLHNSHLQGEATAALICTLTLEEYKTFLKTLISTLCCFRIHFICSAPPTHNKSAARKKAGAKAKEKL